MFRVYVFNTIENTYYSLECSQIILKKNNSFLVINEEACKRSIIFNTFNYCIVKYCEKKIIFNEKINLYMCNKTNYISLFIIKK